MGRYKPLYGHQIASDFYGYGKKNFPFTKRIRFYRRARMGYRLADRLLKQSLQKKECFFGPFKGEFGHFLGHNLPFLSYLHSQGVKIYYCGLDLHLPFLVDQNGQSIIHDFTPLRDFFNEVEPETNETKAPKDVESQIQDFRTEASKSGLPFWDLSDNFWYWFCFRIWIFCRPVHVRHDLAKLYGTKAENSAVIFPRKKGVESTQNNGEPWDYDALAKIIAPHFENVYFCGHPALSHDVQASGNIKLALNGDNEEILRLCSNSRVIINQHSGTVYLGAYTNSRVLVLYKPKRRIAGMEDTLIFNEFLKPEHPFEFAWSEEDVGKYCELLAEGIKTEGNTDFSYPF